MIKARIKGIPCLVEMTGGHYQKPDYNSWDSDIDYHGGWHDIEFSVYDSRGRPAPWLERLMSEKDEDNIVQLLIENER